MQTVACQARLDVWACLIARVQCMCVDAGFNFSGAVLCPDMSAHPHSAWPLTFSMPQPFRWNGLAVC